MSTLRPCIPLPSLARIGLDIDGGTGSFAAHMAKLGVTVVTTAADEDSTGSEAGGVPFSEAIAARGLVPLHVPKEVRGKSKIDQTVQCSEASRGVIMGWTRACLGSIKPPCTVEMYSDVYTCVVHQGFTRESQPSLMHS